MIDTKNRLALMMIVAISSTGWFSRDDDSKDSKTWRACLPMDVQASLLWCADHEEGTLFDWEYDQDKDNNGGGVFTTGPKGEAVATATQSNPFTGKFCAATTIRNATQSKNGDRAVRLMRWTDKPWDQGGAFLPKSAYYGVWMRIDHSYSPRNPGSESGGWWNVFQFKSVDAKGDSQPVWVLNIGNHSETGGMQFYLYSDQNKPTSVTQRNPVPIPVRRWFHVEAFYEQSKRGATDGRLSVWQDGRLILSAEKVQTKLAKELIWGIGNYTDHIAGDDKLGTATILFDDATISTKPTHKYVNSINQ